MTSELFRSELSTGGTFLLDVPLSLGEPSREVQVYANQVGFKRKTEYHVTVVGIDLAETIKELDKTNEVEQLIEAQSWMVELTDIYAELAKDDEFGVHRQSIIRLVNLLELSEFTQKLEALVKFPVSVPPAHITLYTKNYDRGIGVYSDADLERLKVRDIEGNVGQSLL